jgi:hypothetical protein
VGLGAFTLGAGTVGREALTVGPGLLGVGALTVGEGVGALGVEGAVAAGLGVAGVGALTLGAGAAGDGALTVGGGALGARSPSSGFCSAAMLSRSAAPQGSALLFCRRSSSAITSAIEHDCSVQDFAVSKAFLQYSGMGTPSPGVSSPRTDLRAM